jgi:RHS repeat-associated protein
MTRLGFKYYISINKFVKLVYENRHDLQYTTKTGAATNTTDYSNGIEYKNNTLDAIYHSEGRVKYNGTTPRYEYTLTDHLGNGRVYYTDLNWDGACTTNEILQDNHYYPFGLNHTDPRRNTGGVGVNLYQYNGKELLEDNGLGWNHYGARCYDAAVGRWWVVDPLAEKYKTFNSYNYVLCRPSNGLDPDGRRVYFIGGAGNDVDGWNYINRWGKAFEREGIQFYRMNASHGKFGDAVFTDRFREDIVSQSFSSKESSDHSKMVDETAEAYMTHLKSTPLNNDEQLNLAGYSYGSVLQAQVALELANRGVVINNLILIGSPITDNSKLMKRLENNSNIKNIMRVDIEGDLLSNPQSAYDYIKGIIQNSSDDGPHFDLARPSAEADRNMEVIIEWFKSQGVKN